MKVFPVLLVVLVAFSSTWGLEIKEITRNIDLTNHLARQNILLTIENPSSSALQSFPFELEETLALQLSTIKASFQAADEDSANIPLSVSKVDGVQTKDNLRYKQYTLDLGAGIEAGETAVVAVDLSFVNLLVPFPKEITQNDAQFVKYSGDSVYFFSSANVGTQTTIVNLASSKIESFTQVEPVRASATVITYGPYENIAAFSFSPLYVHSENSAPFISVTSLVREFEISHYGNVAVEETYNVLHAGASLTGPFSRYDYQRNPTAAATAVEGWGQILEEGAEDIYYRDVIGNISTSNARIEEDGSVLLEIRPRFLMFGGWKTEYYLGYNLEAGRVLGVDSSSGKYVLEVACGPKFSVDIDVQELTTRFVLPEGVSNVKVQVPGEWVGETETNEGVRVTYLDTSGRKVYSMTTKNVATADSTAVCKVTYDFGTITMLKEPLLLVIAFFILFVIAIGLVRLKLSISLEDGELERKDAAVRALLTELKNAAAKFVVVCNKLESLGTRFKITKKNAFYQERNLNTTQMTQCFTNFSKIRGGLEELDEDLGVTAEAIIAKAKATQKAMEKLVDLKFQYKQRDIPNSVYDPATKQGLIEFGNNKNAFDSLVADLTAGF